MKRFFVILLSSILIEGTFFGVVTGQELSHSFEFRYINDDPAANGETDFKGETAVFDTNGRIDFLRHYAEYAKSFFNDPKLAREVVTDKEVEDFLVKMKDKTLPQVRERILQNEWKWLGCAEGQRQREQKELAAWEALSGTRITNGNLALTENTVIRRTIPLQKWRFFLEWKTRTPRTNTEVQYSLSEGGTEAVTVGFSEEGYLFYHTGNQEIKLQSYKPDTWYEFKLEVDLAEGCYNFYVNGRLKADFVKLENNRILEINTFSIRGNAGVALDDIWGVGYTPTEDVRVPFKAATFVDEDFKVVPSVSGWNKNNYDDSGWKITGLPRVHGGERYARQDLFLRTKIRTGDFSHAVLNVETLDPGGEIYVNGKLAAHITNRHPAEIDISKYLKANETNMIAVRVRWFISERPMGHAPDDNNIGWFAGRMFLDLTEKTYIDDVFVYAEDTAEPAHVRAKIRLINKSEKPFNGKVFVNCYPWYPDESNRAAAAMDFPVNIRGQGEELYEKVIEVPGPELWTFDNPALYRFEVILKNDGGKPVDDDVVISGIRTVSQEGGIFRVNGKPEMLNGAQIMGFRMPFDRIAAWNRCAPIEWLAKELIMTKRMNGNLMRVHVHAWHGPSGNINDPRIAEICDQLGLMLIWGTTSWIRGGEAWDVDFEGYPKYMRQVYNHPSIVMWEVTNHPHSVRGHHSSESNLFYDKLYNTIYPVDSSRLISGTSHILTTHYGNDQGTIDHDGNPLEPCPAWTAHMVTRGNQDSITGYGKEWSVLRTWPPPYQQDFLDSRERAYFNFEHEESIGQPNWSLVKGKPWYRIQSYEWGYDEGSIGRRLTADEWQESQAWQAFSAYESMRKQRILDYDGFSWCCLHGGANSGTYKKPLVDCFSHAKLAFYTNRMVFQRILAGSDNVDVVYGSEDVISPVILNLGEARTVELTVAVRNERKEIVDSKTYTGVKLPAGRTVTTLPGFKPSFPANGYYAVEYRVR